MVELNSTILGTTKRHPQKVEFKLSACLF